MVVSEPFARSLALGLADLECRNSRGNETKEVDMVSESFRVVVLQEVRGPSRGIPPPYFLVSLVAEAGFR